MTKAPTPRQRPLRRRWRALAAGLQSPRDRATAHKLLAFITCTSERLAACEAAFRAARQADPAFVLSRSEAGHPVWGPVYRKVLALTARHPRHPPTTRHTGSLRRA
jgi:hypothetical protein